MSLREEVAQLFAAFAGQQAILTIPRPYLALCDNDHVVALFLSQCVYWSDRTTDPNGWFAKSYVDWESELGTTEYQIRRATKKLADYGLETDLRRSPIYKMAATLHYRVNRATFSDRVLKFLQNGGLRNSRTGPKETPERSLTESTSESTSEIVVDRARAEAVFTLYQNEIGMLTGHIADEIKSAMVDYPAGWLEDAIREASRNNKRSWAYTQAILARWQREGKDKPKTGRSAGAPKPAPATPPPPTGAPLPPTANPFGRSSS